MSSFKPPFINKTLKFTGEKQKAKYEELQRLPLYEKGVFGYIKRICGAFYVLMGWAIAVRVDEDEPFK